MTVMCAEQVGPDNILAKNAWGKEFIQRHYKHPITGKVDEYSIFSYKGGKVRPSIFMPITTDGNVIAIRQFREAANEVILELPGGNPKKEQTAEDVVRAELLEETGHEAGTIINLAPNNPIYLEPSSYTVSMLPFLVTGCRKVAELNLDETENLEVEIFTLARWLTACITGEVHDSKSIAITFLALPHLGFALPQ